MKSKTSFSLKARMTSVRYAYEGLHSFFTSQHNAIVHLVFTLAVIVATILLPVSTNEIIALILSIGFVWSAEIFNTAIEVLLDHVSPERHPRVKFIKDVAAAAVLVSALTAATVGLFIFIPKIF
jgi:diacylglycerol kinase (ATP)